MSERETSSHIGCAVHAVTPFRLATFARDSVGEAENWLALLEHRYADYCQRLNKTDNEQAAASKAKDSAFGQMQADLAKRVKKLGYDIRMYRDDLIPQCKAAIDEWRETLHARQRAAKPAAPTQSKVLPVEPEYTAEF